jgi:hypothetical protein
MSTMASRRPGRGIARASIVATAEGVALVASVKSERVAYVASGKSEGEWSGVAQETVASAALGTAKPRPGVGSLRPAAAWYARQLADVRIGSGRPATRCNHRERAATGTTDDCLLKNAGQRLLAVAWLCVTATNLPVGPAVTPVTCRHRGAPAIQGRAARMQASPTRRQTALLEQLKSRGDNRC